MQKFFKLTSIFVILALMISPAFSEQEPEGEFEPLSQEFLEWQAEHSTKSKANEDRDNALPSDPETEYKGGYIPIPVDLSHLADNPPKEENSSAIAERSRAAIPSKFDLRDQNAVTSLKSQLPYGTCWAFASIGAIESNMLMQGKGTYDLSEMHLAWFAYRNSDKSKAFYNLNSSSLKTVLDYGGNSFYSTALFARLAGPANENDVPYVENKQPANSTPEEYKRVLRLRDVFYINTTQINVNKDSETRDIIKNRIMKNGSVVASYKNNNSAYNKTSANGTAFYSTSGSEGHAIQIVGWDDDYPISAFKTKPSEKGAWLIKNSWGKTWNSGMGDDGYFWMSYKQNLTGGTAFVAEEANENMNVYSYDPLGWCSTWGYKYETNYAANIFKSERNETLSEVGFYTTDNNVEYEISIYKGLSSVSASSPVNGSPVSKTTGTIAFAGYHTVALDTEVSLSSGEIFSVVVKFNNYVKPAVENKTSFSPNVEIETGSLFSYNGTSWITGESKNMNACIKAFTVTGKSKPTILGSYPPDAVINNSYSYKFSSSGTHPITWSTSGSVPSGLSINSSTGEFSGTPTAKGNYTFTVKATNSEGSDSKTFTMNVKDISITPSEITGYVNTAMKEKLEISGTTAKSWSVSSGTLPRGISLNKNTGAITGSPKATGTSTVSFTAQTETGNFSNSVAFTIKAQLIKPRITTSKFNDGLIGSEYSATVRATGTTPITFSAEGYPKGLNFNSSTGTLSGTPTEAGTFTIKIKAENEATEVLGGTVTKSLRLVIKPIPPSITPISELDDAVMNEEFETVTFTTSAGTAPITWTASGLPSGLKLDKNTGVLSGTPKRAGTFKITIRASNSGGRDSIVVPLTVLQKPEITTKKLSNATTDRKYTARISARGTADLEWEISGLPDTLSYSLDAKKTTATITGTPTEAEECEVKIKVSNKAGKTETTLPLIVKGVKPNLTVSLGTGKVNQSYSGKITATGTKPITISYSISDSDKKKFGIDDLSDLGLSFNSDPSTGTATITGQSEISVKNLPITFSAANSVTTTPVTKIGRLTISGTRPTFTTSTSNYYYEPGEEVNIDLEVNGSKNITIAMTSSNGFSLEQTDDYSATISGTAPTPNQIKRITLRVTASNADGKVTKNIFVQTTNDTAKLNKTKSTNETEKTEKVEIFKASEPQKETALPSTEIAADTLTLGEERSIESVPQDKISKLEAEGYIIASILPEISVTESGLFELETELSQLASHDEVVGKENDFELFWFAFPKDVEDSEDDKIIEFYDMEGNDIKTVPENHEIALSAWFEEGIIYEPIIAVKEKIKE